MPGQKVGQALMGRLILGPASSVMRRSGTHGSVSAGPNPLEAPGSGRLTGGVGPGPKVPIMPPFSPAGEGDQPRLEKRIRLTVITWGTIYH